jgi:hypothetical protein
LQDAPIDLNILNNIPVEALGQVQGPLGRNDVNAEDVTSEFEMMYEEALKEIETGSIAPSTKTKYQREFFKFQQFGVSMGRAVDNFTEKNLHNVVIVYLQSKWVANDAKSISLIYVISSSIIWSYRYHPDYNRGAKDYDQSNGSGNPGKHDSIRDLLKSYRKQTRDVVKKQSAALTYELLGVIQIILNSMTQKEFYNFYLEKEKAEKEEWTQHDQDEFDLLFPIDKQTDARNIRLTKFTFMKPSERNIVHYSLFCGIVG